jgi:hypothetical protein
MKNRIPRKLKKKFKAQWHKKSGYKCFIRRSSIQYKKIAFQKKVWGCETYFKV